MVNLKFKVDWTNNSIQYSAKEKNIVLKAMEKAVPFTQGKYLHKFENKFKTYAKYKLEENHPLLDQKIIAFAGLGFNKKFFDQLNNYGFEVLKTIDFPDHHQYSIEDIYTLLDQANSLDAHLLTTEKDHIRIPNEFKKTIKFIKGKIKVNNENNLIEEFKKNIA